jgi:hypothetical protein
MINRLTGLACAATMRQLALRERHEAARLYRTFWLHDRMPGFGWRLRGAKPSELPVQTATKYETLLNIKTATALGLTVPGGLLVAAERGDRMNQRRQRLSLAETPAGGFDVCSRALGWHPHAAPSCRSAKLAPPQIHVSNGVLELMAFCGPFARGVTIVKSAPLA